MLAHQLMGENYDKIIIQSGNVGLISNANTSCNPFGNYNKNPTLALYRVIVICLN